MTTSYHSDYINSYCTWGTVRKDVQQYGQLLCSLAGLSANIFAAGSFHAISGAIAVIALS